MTRDLNFAKENFIPRKNIKFLSHGLSILKIFLGGINQRNGEKHWSKLLAITSSMPPMTSRRPPMTSRHALNAEKASGEIQHMIPALFQTKCTKLDHPSQISRKKSHARFVCLDMLFSYFCLLASPDPLPVPQPKSKHRPIAWCFHVGKKRSNTPVRRNTVLNFELLWIYC